MNLVKNKSLYKKITLKTIVASVARAARLSRGFGSSASAHLSRSSVPQAHSQQEAGVRLLQES